MSSFAGKSKIFCTDSVMNPMKLLNCSIGGVELYWHKIEEQLQYKKWYNPGISLGKHDDKKDLLLGKDLESQNEFPLPRYMASSIIITNQGKLRAFNYHGLVGLDRYETGWGDYKHIKFNNVRLKK
jgi:hypothetical protein